MRLFALSSGLPRSHAASVVFSTLPHTSAAFCKLQQLSATISVCKFGSFTNVLVSYATTRLYQEGVISTKPKCHTSGLPHLRGFCGLFHFPQSSRGFCGLFHFPHSSRGFCGLFHCPQTLAAFRIFNFSYGTPAAFRTTTSSSSFQEVFRVCIA
jgi:hypothetical protein